MDIFGDAHDGGPKRSPLPKICHTHPTTVIAYLKEIQKTFKTREVSLTFC